MCLMIGPPGAGKTLLARAMPGILPRMTIDEALDVTRIYSVADQLPPDVPLIRNRPFRAPHHTISPRRAGGRRQLAAPGRDLPGAPRRALPGRAARVRPARPGSAAPADRRQGRHHQPRAGLAHLPRQFPADRGHEPLPVRLLRRPGQSLHLLRRASVTKYQKRISGPLLDRIDIHIEVPRVEYDKLSDQRLGEPSAAIQARVEAARERQRERFAGAGGRQSRTGGSTRTPSPATPTCARRRCASICSLDDTGRALMKTAMSQLQLSARAYHRVLKLARTIADLAGGEQIGPQHLAEALQYRPRSITG